MDLFDKIVEINTIHLGPDDILIIKVPNDIGDVQLDSIQEQWKKRFPKTVNQLMIVTNDVEFFKIKKGDLPPND